MLLGKLYHQHRRENNFSFSPKVMHVGMAFDRWKSLTLKLRQAIFAKERFINQWLIAYEHYRNKTITKCFQAFRIMGTHLRVTENKELELRSQVEEKLLNATFYRWIDSFNQRMHYREQVLKATAHWSDRVQM